MRRLALLWLVSLAIVSALTAALTVAQTQLPEPRILSGSDVGFRVEGQDWYGNPTGTFVVQIDGECLAVGSAPIVHPAKAK